MKLRPAREQDAPALLSIYSPYVLETNITFECAVPTLEEFAGRIRKISSVYPYIVAEEDGEILGYTYAYRFKKRAAYDWAVETTIYVKRSYHGKGLGRTLYGILENALAKQGVTNLNACIASPNPASVAFHERMGWHSVGEFTKCGFKLGRWWNMLWMEKIITAHPTPPKPIVPFPELLRRGFELSIR